MDSVQFLGLLLFAVFIDVAALDVIRCPEENENVTALATDGCCDGVSNCQQTKLCQAVVGMGLMVECSVCPPGDSVTWETPQGGPHTSNNRTLTLNVSQTMTAKGYFNCSCGSTHQNMSFNVTVENKATPNVTVHPESMVENNYTLPSLRTALNMTHGDRVCLNMTTTGYPTPMYTWSVHSASNMSYVDISTNPCFSQPSYGMLCVLPTHSQLLNTGEGLDLQVRANVTNVAGYITLFQHSYTDVSDSWYIKPHTSQSSGSISLNDDGVGTAWCAAYSELTTTLNFSVCIINDSYSLGEQACLFVSDQLKCHPCGYTSQNLSLTVKMATNQLGFKVALCDVSSSITGQFVCIASRKQSFGPQVIGSFEFTSNNNKSESFWMKWGLIIIGACGGALVVIILLIVVIVAIVVAIVIWKRCRRKRDRYRRLVSDNEPSVESTDDESGNYNNLETSTEAPDQRRAVSKSGENVLQTYPPGSNVPMTDHQSDSAYGTDEQRPPSRPPSSNILKGSVRSSSPVSSVVDSIEMPISAVVNKHEAILEEKCWVPFGIQSYHIRPEGGSIFLVPDTEEHKNLEAIKIEVPKDAVNVPILEIRSAVIVNGPFSVPDGHKLASMVVYVYFDPRCISKPLFLHLPNWMAKSESLSPEIVIASHSFDHTKCQYEFKFENISFSGNGAIPISGHCSLFSEVIAEKAVSSYYLTAYQSVQAGRNKVDVLVTYESDTWIRILRKYRFKECGEMMGSSLSFRFKGDNDRIRMKLRAGKGPGWSAAINNQKKSIASQDVDISRYGEGALKSAVREGNYPPGFVCDIRFMEHLSLDGEPHHLCLEALGGDFEEQPQFSCVCYQEKDYPCAVKIDRPFPGSVENSAEHGQLTYADIGPNESPVPQLSPVVCNVKEMHEQLIRSLNIDATLLAAMNQKELLSQVDLERIQAMLSNGTARCDIASHVITNILLRSAPGVFVDKLERFRDALADHDDSSNKQFAEDFTKIMKEHLPSTEEFMDAEGSFDQ